MDNVALCFKFIRINAYQDDHYYFRINLELLSLCVFDKLQEKYNIENKNLDLMKIGNNDMSRYDEIMELNSQYLSLEDIILF